MKGIRTTSLLVCAALSLGVSVPAQAAPSESTLDTPFRGSETSNPEQRSTKLTKQGIRLREKAAAEEAKAAAATSDKAREKALSRAQKHYERGLVKLKEAVRLDTKNYHAFNELGYALRKTGDNRKAIGAYNYALQLNPNFHQAMQYRAEACLALGLLGETQKAYMVLFNNDRALADELMTAIEAWGAAKGETLTEDESKFLAWAKDRKRLAKISNDLSFNNTRSW